MSRLNQGQARPMSVRQLNCWFVVERSTFRNVHNTSYWHTVLHFKIRWFCPTASPDITQLDHMDRWILIVMHQCLKYLFSLLFFILHII